MSRHRKGRHDWSCPIRHVDRKHVNGCIVEPYIAGTHESNPVVQGTEIVNWTKFSDGLYNLGRNERRVFSFVKDEKNFDMWIGTEKKKKKYEKRYVFN